MLTKLLKLVKEKYEIDKNSNWCKWSITYFKWLQNEVLEVEYELKENNLVYLEDELWDVLFSYLNLLKQLEYEWKISSIKNIILRSEKKFEQRIKPLKWQKDLLPIWNKIKAKQKQRLKKEHNLKYKN